MQVGMDSFIQIAGLVQEVSINTHIYFMFTKLYVYFAAARGALNAQGVGSTLLYDSFISINMPLVD